MDANAIVPERRRQHFPPVEAAHLDDEVRDTGRRGVDDARRALDLRRPPEERRAGRFRRLRRRR